MEAKKIESRSWKWKINHKKIRTLIQDQDAKNKRG